VATCGGAVEAVANDDQNIASDGANDTGDSEADGGVHVVRL